MSKYEYTDGETDFEGYLAFENIESKRPCVLIVHAWDGLNSRISAIADDFAQKGLVAFAIDVYGKGKRGKMEEDNSYLMNPFLEDRALLRKRLLVAFKEAKKLSMVIPDKIAVIGYCFGGLCALDLARANPEGLQGAVSIHGRLTPPNLNGAPSKINASLLVLHGWDDPLVTAEDALGFTQEMKQSQADWQLHFYGHATHGFTFDKKDLPTPEIKYNKKAHERSQKAIDDFLEEILI